MSFDKKHGANKKDKQTPNGVSPTFDTSFRLGFKAGNTKFHLKVWENFSSDPEILNIVRGIKIPFISQPAQVFVPRPYKFNDLTSKRLWMRRFPYG